MGATWRNVGFASQMTVPGGGHPGFGRITPPPRWVGHGGVCDERCSVAGRRARGGGGSARRAERTAVSFDVADSIRRNIPNFEILNEEALADHRVERRDGAGRNRRELRRKPGRAGAVARGRGRREGRAGAHPARSGPQAVLHRAAHLHPARPQPGAQRRGRRAQSGAGAGLRPALRARLRRRAPLCDASRISGTS